MGVYTHIGLADQSTAIESPPPPQTVQSQGPSRQRLKATGTDGVGGCSPSASTPERQEQWGQRGRQEGPKQGPCSPRQKRYNWRQFAMTPPGRIAKIEPRPSP